MTLRVDPAAALRSAPEPRPAATGMRRTLVPLGGDRSLAVVEAGRGRPVVLIHGTLTLLEDMWLALAPALLPGGRVIALDRPGHGSSRRRRLVDASPWRQVELIREGLAALGVERPVLVGHSYGGTVALCFAQAFPEATAGVVALAPLCFPEPRLEQVLFGPRAAPAGGDLLSRALAAGVDPCVLPLLWRAIFLPQGVPPAFAAGFPFERVMTADALSREGEDALAAGPALARAAFGYAACPVPARILGGTADLVVGNGLHGSLAAGMMPGGRFAWIPGVGHMLHHAVPEAVAAAVGDLA